MSLPAVRIVRAVVDEHTYLGTTPDDEHGVGRARCSCGWSPWVRGVTDGLYYWRVHVRLEAAPWGHMNRRRHR